MMRIVVPVAALFSVFWFPYSLTLFLSFVAGVFVPWFPLVLGILSDLLYYVPSVSFLPMGTVAGLILSVISLGMRSFLKTRIM